MGLRIEEQRGTQLDGLPVKRVAFGLKLIALLEARAGACADHSDLRYDARFQITTGADVFACIPLIALGPLSSLEPPAFVKLVCPTDQEKLSHVSADLSL